MTRGVQYTTTSRTVGIEPAARTVATSRSYLFALALLAVVARSRGATAEMLRRRRASADTRGARSAAAAPVRRRPGAADVPGDRAVAAYMGARRPAAADITGARSIHRFALEALTDSLGAAITDHRGEPIHAAVPTTPALVRRTPLGPSPATAARAASGTLVRRLLLAAPVGAARTATAEPMRIRKLAAPVAADRAVTLNVFLRTLLTDHNGAPITDHSGAQIEAYS